MNEVVMPTRRLRAATIKDVAQRVGVSPMTVSRVINNKGRFSEGTREAVERAIKELGFSRNPAARSLALARSVRIGVLYDKPNGAYLSELLIGLIDEAGRSGHQIVLQRGSTDNPGDAIAELLARGVDGVILPPPFADEQAIIERFRDAQRPVVVISGEPKSGAAAVRIDDYAAARDLTRSLIARGHHRIGFVMGDDRQAAARARQRGYEDACRDGGVDPGPYAQGDFSYRSGIDAATQLLRGDRPSAIFASNDDMAAAVITVAHRQGLELPRDLAVVGFDDTHIAIATWPELTTVHQPLGEMARAATDFLLQAIGDPEDRIETIILPHRIVQRGSV